MPYNLDIKDKIKLMQIKLILKMRKILSKRQLTDRTQKTEFTQLREINKHLDANELALQLYKKDEEKKGFIFELLLICKENGINIELIDFNNIFDYKDMSTILEKNPKAKINLRYLINSYYMGLNVETEYKISDYLEIMKKINYLADVAKYNFREKDEQIMFGISQLKRYISFDEQYQDKSEEEIKEISSLKGAILKGKTVCIGYAMALERYLSSIGVESRIVIGIGRDLPTQINRRGKDKYAWNQIKHAWNQIRIGENWYNADISGEAKENPLKWILSDDNEFKENGVHISTGAYEEQKCTTKYSKKQELWEKMKKIQNVLIDYDRGKTDKLLRYSIDTEQQENPEFETKKNNKIIQNMEERT